MFNSSRPGSTTSEDLIDFLEDQDEGDMFIITDDFERTSSGNLVSFLEDGIKDNNILGSMEAYHESEYDADIDSDDGEAGLLSTIDNVLGWLGDTDHPLDDNHLIHIYETDSESDSNSDEDHSLLVTIIEEELVEDSYTGRAVLNTAYDPLASEHFTDPFEGFSQGSRTFYSSVAFSSIASPPSLLIPSFDSDVDSVPHLPTSSTHFRSHDQIVFNPSFSFSSPSQTQTNSSIHLRRCGSPHSPRTVCPYSLRIRIPTTIPQLMAFRPTNMTINTGTDTCIHSSPKSVSTTEEQERPPRTQTKTPYPPPTVYFSPSTPPSLASPYHYSQLGEEPEPDSDQDQDQNNYQHDSFESWLDQHEYDSIRSPIFHPLGAIDFDTDTDEEEEEEEEEESDLEEDMNVQLRWCGWMRVFTWFRGLW